MTGWQPTQALLRGSAVGAVLLAVGVLAGRVEYVVLATPVALLALLGLVHRPEHAPEVTTSLSRSELREGEHITVYTRVEGDGLEAVARTVHPSQHLATRPGSTTVTAADEHGRVRLSTAFRALRWGRYDVGAGQVATHSRWGGFRWGPAQVGTGRVTVLPEAAPFDATADAPNPVGLVGAHRSRQRGEGTEFAGVRPFGAGDRLRRIHWRTSLRTGDLHVVATTAEQDTEVVLIVDASTAVGASGGLPGTASSLDISVRAAAAIAEHHLRDGDRVGLRVLGGSGQTLPSRAGFRQRHRILHTLAQVHARRSTEDVLPDATIRWGLSAGAIVVVLSPLLSPVVATLLATLGRRGLQVAAVDTLPRSWLTDAGGEDAETVLLARRIRMLERRAELDHLAVAGIPVVAWRGAGTLDEVLRGFGRRARAPRVVAR